MWRKSDNFISFTNIKGKINIETSEITSTFSGVMGSKEYGKEYPFNGTINSKITDYLNTFNGVILDDEGDRGKFTATK
jgi:hypothetical protein